ncbi:MAG: dockerin type I repeat-containing protein, partial [Nitrospira sp.]|nr:dockerin type I repeat-containing protein [Nitrospira sp.]
GVSPALFSFEGSDYNPDTTILEPMEAYWVFNGNNFPVTLAIPPIPVQNAEVRTMNDELIQRSAFSVQRSSPGGWRVKLSAVMGEAKDTHNYLGVDSEGQDGLDELDYPEPPDIHGLSLYFPHPGWNKWSANYTTDIRRIGDGPILIWDAEVRTELPNSQVQLSWSLEGIDGKVLRLRDVEGNQLIHMGQIRQYSYNTGGGEVRHFQVIAKVVFPKRGDVNGDGQVNSSDALLILQVVQRLRTTADPVHAQVMENGDVTRDGQVDQADVQRIQECEAQILSGPACDFSQ